MFGYPDFRPGQAAAVEALIAGRDVQLVLATGGGKSLCYQVPAILAARQGRGPTLVVSPLIALMENQIAALRSRGVSAAALHSGLPWAEQRTQLANLSGLSMIYASPERLANARFKKLLVSTGVAYVVVDEAHCVSEWGHDFRPDYRKLSGLCGELGVPIMATTATATPAVLQDISASLGQTNPVQIIGSFSRANLTFSVEHMRGDAARARRALEILQSAGFTPKQAPGRAIIYVATRKKAQSVCKVLRAAKLPAAYYHAGRTDSARANVQARFTAGKTTILVATSAFGMGVDLPDVRHVIHTQAPGTIEAYYQQAGRAGRDGKPARCTLLYSPADTRIFHQLTSEGAMPGLRVGHRMLGDYIFGSTCRQMAFAKHFGIPMAQRCGACDVCTRPGSVAEMVRAARNKSSTEATTRRKKATADSSVLLTTEQDDHILAFVAGLRSPVGKRLVALGLRGSRAKDVLRKKMEDNPRYGVLTGVPEKSLVLAIERLLSVGQLAKRGRKYPTVWIPGKPVRGASRSTTRSTRPRPTGLERELKLMRRRYAKKGRIKPYQVFPDRTLAAILQARPDNLDELGELWGMGGKRLARYGPEVLRLVSEAKG
ncbi:MAG: ATP-dependent DNA helicase RecQ [Myxococcota bacterium]